MNMNKKIRKGNLMCCVVGCHNTYGNSPDLRFYSFPGRPWEVERKNRWIQAVKRLNADKSLWTPKKYSKICSNHFINGIKSDNPLNPAYVPTIFPDAYKITSKGNSSSRYHRLQHRNKQKKKENDALKELKILQEIFESNQADDTVDEEMITSRDADCQVNFLNFEEHEVKSIQPFIFESNKDIGNAYSTQASIPSGINFYNHRTFVSSEMQTSHFLIFNGYESITNEQQLIDTTGITFAVFNLLLNNLSKIRLSKLGQENRLLLFLMKLKLGITYSALSLFFCVHRTSCSRTFKNILLELSVKFSSFIYWPSKWAIQACLPEAFKIHYPKTRVIIDCTEIKTEEPARADERVFLYSNYKHGFTIKFLVGITPNGLISFISDCYGGRTSDAFIVNDSGFLDLLEPEDLVLADKGFPKIITDSHAVVVIPPMLHNGRFSEAEIEETYNIASVRIHVERAIQRLKIFNIFQKLPNELVNYADQIVTVCSALVNLQSPIIKMKNESDLTQATVST